MSKPAGRKHYIYIDTNIYLRFYDSTSPEFKKLLSSLKEIRSRIIVTTQIIDEIDRNKLSVFSDSLRNYVIDNGVTRSILPEHFDGDSKQIKNWNKKRGKLLGDTEDLNKELRELLDHLLEKVSESRDEVSLALKEILAHPIMASREKIQEAVLRKKLGNPPGKHGDPIGDELNWILLLDRVSEIDSLWIVTNDRDYCKEYKGRLFLNPYLHKELIAGNPKIRISLFDKLSVALKNFNESHTIEALPEEKELKLIVIAEPDSHLHPSLQEEFYAGFISPERKVCPKCHFGSALLLSGYSDKTKRYVCPACNAVFNMP